MKARTVYSSREEFERKTPYVCVESPSYQGQKCAPAQIVKSYTSKRSAEINRDGGRIMTRKRAEKFIQRWNGELEAGNYDTNF